MNIPEGPMRMLVSEDDAYLYLLQDLDPHGHVVIMDRKTQRALYRIPVGRRPISMAVEGETGYVADYLSDDVTVVALKAAEAVKTIPVGRRPIRVATSDNIPYVLVTNYGSDTISVIDKRSLKVTQTLAVPRRPGDMAIRPDGRFVYVLHRGAAQLSVLDLQSLRFVQRIPIGEFPSGIAISRDGRWLFVSDAHTDALQVLETEPLRVVQKIAMGKQPIEIIRASGRDEVYVLNGASQEVWVVDPLRPETISAIPLPYTPRCMTATSDGGQLYISYGQAVGEMTVVEMAGRKPVRSYNVPVIVTKG